jgi:hypothetical protein
MNAVKATGLHAAPNAGWGKGDGIKLRSGDQPMLPSGYPCDGRVKALAGDFFRHTRRKSPGAPISSPSLPVFGRRRPSLPSFVQQPG